MKPSSCPLLIILPITIFLSGCSCNPNPKVVNPWARPATFQTNSAVYMEIQGACEDDKLIRASSPITDELSFHKSVVDDDGVVHMEHIPFIPLPAMSDVNLEPGGLHIMLMNLKQDLEVDDQFEITLIFENSGEQRIHVSIETH